MRHSGMCYCSCDLNACAACGGVLQQQVLLKTSSADGGEGGRAAMMMPWSLAGGVPGLTVTLPTPVLVRAPVFKETKRHMQAQGSLRRSRGHSDRNDSTLGCVSVGSSSFV